MNITGVTWVGTRTAQYDEAVRFFSDVLGLSVLAVEEGFTVLSVPDGATVEIFGPGTTDNHHLTHPVAGFSVNDLPAALDELVAASTEIVLPMQGGAERRWLHFRAPDGFVYELVEAHG